MADNKEAETGGQSSHKSVEQNLSGQSETSDGIYDDASSGLLFTIDDVTLGDSSTEDVYIDCVANENDLGKVETNNNESSDVKDDTMTDGPLYYELEGSLKEDKVHETSTHLVQQITETFEAMSHKKNEMKKRAFEDDFEPLPGNVAEGEDPFAGFQDVENTVPVYELATAGITEKGDSSVPETEMPTPSEENAEDFDPIYDSVPSRSSSERETDPQYLSLVDDPIYEDPETVKVKIKGQGQNTEGYIKGQCQKKEGHNKGQGQKREGHKQSQGQKQAQNVPIPEVGTVYSIAKEAIAKSHEDQSYQPRGVYNVAKASSFVVENNYDFLTESHPPRRFPACKQGFGRPVSVHYLDRAEEARKSLRSIPKSLEDGDYDKIQFKKLQPKRKSRSQFYVGTPLEEDETEVFSKEHAAPTQFQDRSPDGGSVSSDRLYESITVSQNSDDGWGSSEFETDDDEVLVEPEMLGEAPDKPLPPTPKQGGGLFLKRMRSFNEKSKNEAYNLDETRCFPVELNAEKHPPPALPDPPDNLTEDQKKKRCVMELTISSERSYINSLERITEDYEKTVLENVAGAKNQVRVVFREAHQLLSHHKMFQIELADRAKNWDKEERIGDIFTASFSKTMLVDAYSTYVNSFAAAMDEIKSVQRTRPNFDEFLRSKEVKSVDRLSIFGLMVKPIQRFPQFIMILQDLLKYTPHDHHDRGALQLALTELENFTHKLNERKRHSEQQFASRQVMNQLSKQPGQALVRTPDQPRRLLRQDDLEQVVGESGNLKSKKVRILLMNDCIMCVKVGIKEQGGYKTERYKLKWMTPIRDMELKDSAITPDMESVVKGGPGKLSIFSTQIDKPEEDPFHLFADLNEMMHDYPVLAQISALINSLKREYYGLTEELIHEHTRDLQRLIQIKDEQLRLVNSCSIILSDFSRNERIRHVFQTMTPTVKHEWCMDFLIAKLAIDKQNNPSWDSGTNDEYDLPPAFFMRCVPVDVPRHYTKMKCAIPVFLASSSGMRLAIQHLWVVTTTPTRGQISIISIHNSKPSLTESFKAADVEITCTEHIPGYAREDKDFAYRDDTVWLGTHNNEVLIFLLTSQDGIRREATASFPLPAAPVALKFVDERVFCSLITGEIAVFTRDNTGLWNVKSPTMLKYEGSVISCMKVMDDNLWLALSTRLLLLDIESLKERRRLELDLEREGLVIDEFVHSGVGIWVSFKHSSKLRLFHLETLENLQEINIASSVNRLLDERKSQMEGTLGDRMDSGEKCVVTSLSASRGLLWIGTNRGFVLTLPLPRLKDGVPLANGRPKISLHSHRGPVKFLIPISYSSSIAELNRNNSLWSSMSAKRENHRPSEVFVPSTEDISSAKENVERRLSVLEDGDEDGDECETPESKDENSNRKSQTEIWQAEIEKSLSDDKKTENPQTETNPDRKNGSEKSPTAKHVARKKSLKDSESFRRSKPKLKSKTLSFRSELANKIAKRNLESSDSEFADDEDDVRMLYGNLVETDEEQDTDGNFTDILSSYEELPKDLGSPENALSVRKDSTATKWDKNVRLPGNASISRKQRGGSPSTHKVATLKKNMCNATIVVCGGDGYCDWNKTKQKHNEDACLLLWIYKF